MTDHANQSPNSAPAPQVTARSRRGLSRLIGLTFASLSAACAGAPAAAPDATLPHVESQATVVLASDLDWQALNPALGDRSPRVANLWGDYKGSGPTGFLIRYADGFESPPHIHNVSYRGVVIEGSVRNDSAAQAMWMPTGSFWAQPRGRPHITSATAGDTGAEGADTVAYLEIDEGPYLIRGVDGATFSEQHPHNLHASNLVWHDLASLRWGKPDATEAGPQPRAAFLWGDPDAGKLHGLLLQVPAGAEVALRTHQGSTFRATVIAGPVGYRAGVGKEAVSLAPGSYFSSTAGAAEARCVAKTACTLYVRAEGHFDAVATHR